MGVTFRTPCGDVGYGLGDDLWFGGRGDNKRLTRFWRPTDAGGYGGIGRAVVGRVGAWALPLLEAGDIPPRVAWARR